ncbi:MAG TPA: hypothetical protein VF855_13815 [Acidimicrobiales bacterium]
MLPLTAVVIVELDGGAPALPAAVAALDLPVTVVTAPDEVGRVALAEQGRWVEPGFADASGKTLTALQARRALAHEGVWELVAAGAGTALVLEVGAELGDDLVATLAELDTSLGEAGCALLHLDRERAGRAYVLSPKGASVLAGAVPDGIVPVELVFELAGLDAFAVDPPLVAAAAHDDSPVLVEHLQVVELAHDGTQPDAAWREQVVSVATGLEPADVVVVVPAGRSLPVDRPEELLAAFAAAETPTIHAEGPVSIGTAAALAAGDDGEAIVPQLTHHVGPGATDTLALSGRVLATRFGTEPLVVTCADAATSRALVAELSDHADRDLTLILRYRDGRAGGERLSATMVAPEIVQLPFWTTEMCQAVVKAAEATGAFQAHPADPVPGHEVSLAAISPRLYAHLEDDLALRVIPALREHWSAIEYFGLRDAFVIKYALGLQEELRLHHDVAQLSATVKLNDGYTGAELEFPRQGWSNAGVPVGDLIVWPSLVTHPHSAAPLRAGVKYGLTIWFELPVTDE